MMETPIKRFESLPFEEAQGYVNQNINLSTQKELVNSLLLNPFEAKYGVGLAFVLTHDMKAGMKKVVAAGLICAESKKFALESGLEGMLRYGTPENVGESNEFLSWYAAREIEDGEIVSNAGHCRETGQQSTISANKTYNLICPQLPKLYSGILSDCEQIGEKSKRLIFRPDSGYQKILEKGRKPYIKK